MLHLAEHSGQLVTRDELLSEVWAGRSVTLDSITQCLMEIRTALGDADHTKIKTLPRRGYLFDLAVTTDDAGIEAPSSVGAAGSEKTGIALALAGIALALVLAIVVWLSDLVTAPDDQSEAEISIAVLPFANRSDRQEDRFFADGIHDDLLATMARISSIRVISRTSVSQYRDTSRRIPEIAEELGVNHILEGGVQRAGDQVRIVVQLIDARSDEHLWAETYDRELTAENLLVVQSEITRKIADSLEIQITDQEQVRIDSISTENIEAYDAYLRGRQLMATMDSENLALATQEFHTATQLDPLFALAWVGLADSSLLLMDRGANRPEEMRPVWEEAAKNALALDAELGEAWSTIARVYMYHERWSDVEVALQKAIDLSPNYARAYNLYAWYLSFQPMRIKDQTSLARQAVELDPNSSEYRTGLAVAYRDQGLYTLAEAQLERVIQQDPDYAPSYYELAYMYTVEITRFDKALPLLQRARELDPANHGYGVLLNFLYSYVGDVDSIQIIRAEMAELGAPQWQLGLADVLIQAMQENGAATRDEIYRLLPEIQHIGFWVRFLGFVLLAHGFVDESRDVFLSAESWLDEAAWPTLIQQSRNYGCMVAWLLLNTGDPELGADLLEHSTRYIEESLPDITEHPDRYFPETCYLTAGEIEKALASIETQLAHNHLNAWPIMHRLPMYDQIRENPRYRAAVAERARQIEIQREAVEKMVPAP